MLNAIILAALFVVPVYTNHNRVAGNVQTMTNIQAWAQAVETAIGRGGTDTNAVCNLITNHVESGYLCTVEAATNYAYTVATNAEARAKAASLSLDDGGEVVGDATFVGELTAEGGFLSHGNSSFTKMNGQDVQTVIEIKNDNQASKLLGNWFYKGNDDDHEVAVKSDITVRWDATAPAGAKLKHGTTAVTAADVGALPVSTSAPTGYDYYVTGSIMEANSLHAMSLASLGSFYVADTFGQNKSIEIDPMEYYRTLYKTDEGEIWTYRKKDEAPTSSKEIAVKGDIPDTSTLASKSSVESVSNTVSEWETYWRGDRVRLSVTNYYGNTSGELPRLRIEEFDHSTTTVVDNVQIISNFFHTVWDENDRHTNYMATTDAKVNAISNTVMDAAWRQTNLQLINKAPRAWQTVTSAGEDAPPNTVWHTAPNTVFAGGTEYAHVAVGEGTICVLTDKGAPVYTDGAEGQFRFQDQSGQNYFGFDVRSAYKIGCRTDGISVNQQTHIVSLTYDLTSATDPSILQSTNLVDWVEAEVEWEQNPPAGTKVCYINCGTSPKGFYQAEIRYAGGSKFLTNMQADLIGGIAASNQTLNVIQSVEPYIISNQVMWRVKQ